MIVAEIDFMCRLLLQHLFLISSFILDHSEPTFKFLLKAFLCWRQRCFPLVLVAIPEPNVQIKVKITSLYG